MSDATMTGTRPTTSNMASVREMIQGCMQCGTCSSSCPNAFAMEYTPRRMWHMILSGLGEEVLTGKAFWYCSACYNCTLRCPHGLPLTNAIGALKRLAGQRGQPSGDKNGAFYRAFMNNVHTFGRVQEVDLMLHYFLAMRDILLPLEYTPLGMKLLRKGKLHTASKAQKGKLDVLFDTVRQMEGAS